MGQVEALLADSSAGRKVLGKGLKSEGKEEKRAHKPGITGGSGSHASKTEEIRIASEKRLMI